MSKSLENNEIKERKILHVSFDHDTENVGIQKEEDESGDSDEEGSSAYIWKHVLIDMANNPGIEVLEEYKCIPLFYGANFGRGIPFFYRKEFTKKLMLWNPGVSQDTQNIIRASLVNSGDKNVNNPQAKAIYSDSVLSVSGIKSKNVQGAIEVSKAEEEQITILERNDSLVKGLVKRAYKKNEKETQKAVKIYVNTYENLNDCWDTLSRVVCEEISQEVKEGHPFVPTSKTPDHALKFGYGVVFGESKFEPEYNYNMDKIGLPKHRLAGLLYIIKAEYSDILPKLETGEIFDVCSLPKIKHRYKNQLEVTYTGSINQSQILAVVPLIYPNFSKGYSADYHFKVLGLSEKDYKKAKKMVTTGNINKNQKLFNESEIILTRAENKFNAFYAKIQNGFCNYAEEIARKFSGGKLVCFVKENDLEDNLGLELREYKLNQNKIETGKNNSTTCHKFLMKENFESTLPQLPEKVPGLCDLTSFPISMLETILSNGRILEFLNKDAERINNLYTLYDQSAKYGDDFSSILDNFVSAVNNSAEHGLEASQIIDLYSDSKLHLNLLANFDDIDSYILENSGDSVMVQFAKEYYSDYIDFEWIREQLGRDNEGMHSAALMDFDCMIDYYESEDHYEKSQEDDYEFKDQESWQEENGITLSEGTEIQPSNITDTVDNKVKQEGITSMTETESSVITSGSLVQKLMRALAAPIPDVNEIDSLLTQKADPFKTDEFGNSAFSIALRQSEILIAKKFIQHKDFDPRQFPIVQELLNDAANISQQDSELKFCREVAANICTQDPTLRNLFCFDEIAAQVCFAEAKECFELLSIGEDSSFLLDKNCFI